MINWAKEKIAAFVVNRLLKQKPKSEVNFANFLTSAYNVFVLMPEDDKEFLMSFEVLNYLETRKKSIRVFTYDHRVSRLPLKFRHNVFSHSETDVTKWNLPSKRVQESLRVLQFDVVIDLNRQASIYNSLAVNIVNTPYRIGFRKDGSDRFYNLQVENSDNADISFKNLLNCLNMF